MGLKWGRAFVALGVLSAMGMTMWACSQGDAHPPVIPDPDGSAKSDVSSSGGDAKADVKSSCVTEDGGCTDLPNCGPHVYYNDVAQNGGSGQGGTVLDGTYVLTDYSKYTGSGGQSGKETQWTSETMTLVSASSGDGGTSDGGGGDGGAPAQLMVFADTADGITSPPAASTGVAQFSATNVNITHTCPNANIFNGTYTASSTQLILFSQNNNVLDQLTYTKQ
jgi:hypothetical protein